MQVCHACFDCRSLLASEQHDEQLHKRLAEHLGPICMPPAVCQAKWLAAAIGTTSQRLGCCSPAG